MGAKIDVPGLEKRERTKGSVGTTPVVLQVSTQSLKLDGLRALIVVR